MVHESSRFGRCHAFGGGSEPGDVGEQHCNLPFFRRRIRPAFTQEFPDKCCWNVAVEGFQPADHGIEPFGQIIQLPDDAGGQGGNSLKVQVCHFSGCNRSPLHRPCDPPCQQNRAEQGQDKQSAAHKKRHQQLPERLIQVLGRKMHANPDRKAQQVFVLLLQDHEPFGAVRVGAGIDVEGLGNVEGRLVHLRHIVEPGQKGIGKPGDIEQRHILAQVAKGLVKVRMGDDFVRSLLHQEHGYVVRGNMPGDFGHSVE